jgi:hypothetical protein
MNKHLKNFIALSLAIAFTATAQDNVKVVR